MKNQEYWQRYADTIQPKDEEIKDVPFILLGKSIAVSFEKAIALFMVGDTYRGMKFLDNCESFLKMKAKEGEESRALLYRILIQWLRGGKISELALENLIVAKRKEILEDILEYNIREIFEKYIKTDPNLKKGDIGVSKSTMKKNSSEKFPFEATGDHLIELGKYLALKGDYGILELVVDTAQEFYGKALQLIPKMLSRKRRKWKDLEDKTDAQIRVEFPGEYEDYLAERDILRGTIPLNRRQGEILLSFCKAYLSELDFRDAKKKLQAFLEEIVNPPNKQVSLLCLPDEIVWVLLKYRLNDLSNKLIMPDPIGSLVQELG